MTRRLFAKGALALALALAPAPAFAGLNLYTLVLGVDPANGQANLTGVFTTSVADLEGQTFEILITRADGNGAAYPSNGIPASAALERQGNGYSASSSASIELLRISPVRGLDGVFHFVLNDRDIGIVEQLGPTVEVNVSIGVAGEVSNATATLSVHGDQLILDQ